MLIDVQFNHVEINGSTISIGGDPNEYSRWSIAKQLIQRYHGLTKIMLRDYISMVEFTGHLAVESLHPTRVEWSLSGYNGRDSVEECLTGGISTPACVHAGSSTVIVPARNFDATPQTTWVDHVFASMPVQRNGLWFLQTKEAIVPPHEPGES